MLTIFLLVLVCACVIKDTTEAHADNIPTVIVDNVVTDPRLLQSATKPRSPLDIR